MDFKDNNSCVYFFVDGKGRIRINKMNNAENDIRDLYFTRHDALVLLFAYDYYESILYVTNISEDNLLKILKLRKEGKKSSSDEVRQLCDQFNAASDYLIEKYKWKGTVRNGKPNHDKVVKLSIKDFSFSWDFLSLSLFNLNFELLNLDVYIVSGLGIDSKMVLEDQSFNTSEGVIKGPAILLNRTNSIYNLNQSIIFQYYSNLSYIYNFDTGDHGFYSQGVADYLEDCMNKYMNNQSLGERTEWYMFVRNGQVFLDKNLRKMTSDDISNKFNHYKSVITFGYVVSADCRYIVMSDVSDNSFNKTGVYSEMYEYLMSNLDKIGHVDGDGNIIDEEPLVLFDNGINEVQWQMFSETPLWVYVKTILSKVYGFNQKDVPILRGSFDEEFGAKYISNVDDSNRGIIEKYMDLEGKDFPFIMLNEDYGSRSSYLGSFHCLMNEYMKFVNDNDDNFGAELISPMKTEGISQYLEYMDDNLLRDPQGVMMFENELLLGIEFSKYYHEYNSFMFMFDILSFDRDRIERAISLTEDGDMANYIAGLADEIHQKMYYILLKMTGVLFYIKYDKDLGSGRDIRIGDVVVGRDFGGNLMRVTNILVDGDSKMYECLDLVFEDECVCDPSNVFLFNLTFDDYEEYNRMIVAQKINNNEQGYYKKMLTKWLRNKKLREIEENEIEDHPTSQSYEALLREQNEFFDHSTDAILTEVLLNDNRVVKNEL